MMWDKFKRCISFFEEIFYRLSVWVACVAVFFSGAALAFELFKRIENVFGILLGFVVLLVFATVSYPVSILVIGAIMDVVEVIKLKCNRESDNQEVIWSKNSRIVFAGKVYSNFDALMHNYFNRKHLTNETCQNFKYGTEFKDKYHRNLYVYVDSAPCFDAEDYLSTPAYYYVFYKKGGRIYALYTDSSSDFCQTGNHVRKLPDCEYASMSLYDIMKHDGFIEGHEW